MWGTTAQIAAHLGELRDAVRGHDAEAAEQIIRDMFLLTDVGPLPA